MISLYSGTPGTGKSLHVASRIYYLCKRGKPVICNFMVNLKNIKKCKNVDSFHFVDNADLTPDFLISFSQSFFGEKNVKESSIFLVIDEAQLMFNAREWSKSGREGWISFFTQHRKYGYDIVLIAQFDRMLDRQIRSLLEYEYIHRKVLNYGWRGVLLSAFFLCPHLFVAVKVWYPLKEKVSSEFFRYNKKFSSLYDTYKSFSE